MLVASLIRGAPAPSHHPIIMVVVVRDWYLDSGTWYKVPATVQKLLLLKYFASMRVRHARH